MIMRNLAPQERDHEGLRLRSYTDEHDHTHNHVICFTHERDIVRDLEIQLVDINTIMTHNFTTKIVDHDDPNITPHPVDDQAELHGEDATIMTLKSGRPQSPEAMDYLAMTISRGSTVHGIIKVFLPFLEKTNHHQSAPAEPA